jgi:hypothetical protein
MQIFKINILIFIKSFACFEPMFCMFHLQRDTLPPTRLLITLVCKQIIPYIPYNLLPEDEPWGSKHVEDIVKIKMLLTKISFSQNTTIYSTM